MVLDGEEQKGYAQHLKLKRGRTATLHNGQITGGQVPPQLWYHCSAVDFFGNVKRLRVDTRPSDNDHLQAGYTGCNEGECVSAKLKELLPDGRAAYSTYNQRSIAVSKLSPQEVPIRNLFDIELHRVTNEFDMLSA